MTKRTPIYQTIIDDITAQISAGDFDYSQPICTEKSICERYDTSRITAKHAIGKLEEKGFLYRKRGAGSFVVRQSTSPASSKIFALVTPFSIVQGGVFRAVEAASQLLTTQGHQLTIHISVNTPLGNAELIDNLYNQDIAGIIYYPIGDTLPTEALNKFVKNNRPVIILDKETNNPQFTNVICDNYQGSQMLAEHLVSYGHVKTAYLSRFKLNELSSVKKRYNGYADFLKQAHLEPHFVHWAFNFPNSFYLLQHIVNTFRVENITAILCENDEVAFNVYMCCQSLGLRVPEDMNITGFDNIEWATTGAAQITTVDQNFNAIGKTIANVLMDDNNVPKSYTTPVRFIPRTSTGIVQKQPSLSLQYAMMAE